MVKYWTAFTRSPIEVKRQKIAPRNKVRGRLKFSLLEVQYEVLLRVFAGDRESFGDLFGGYKNVVNLLQGYLVEGDPQKGGSR